ncbi:MAG: NAD(P)/FAD-dependent oxidoreductase [Acidobacteriia bacterium]|nr:NAD(P)/FAD-dependent oxidoreductase [Terriglobia bacterium]
MSTFASYRQQPPRGERYDAIVIGSGIGGLSAAALLAKHAGKRVLVLERHYTAGGFTHVFHRPGYEWDVGVHYIGEVHNPASTVRRIFDHVTEGRLEWNRMPDVYDRMLIGGRSYDFVSGRRRFAERMKEYFPSEAGAIDRYMELVAEATRATSLFFAEKAIPPLAARLAGGLLRARFLRLARRTTAEVLGELTDNRELIAVLTGQWGDYGLPPGESSFGIHALIAAHYFEGASYPLGGATSIAKAIAPLIEDQGGQILVSAEVAEILVDGANRACGVRMANGSEIRADIVISDAGASNTFSSLLQEQSRERTHVLEEINAIQASMAHLCLYVGLRRAPGNPPLDGTNLWIFPGNDHDGNVRRFSENPEAPFPVLFISFPSAKDPEFEQRHPGRETIEVVTLARQEWFRAFEGTRWHHRGPDYDALKRRFAERMRAELEQHVPAVRGRIEHCELSTPLSTRHFANYQHGEIYGLNASPARFEARCLQPRTHVQNLFLTGQDAAVAGVTGALAGGVLAASAILGRNLMGAIAREKPRDRREPASGRPLARAS